MSQTHGSAECPAQPRDEQHVRVLLLGGGTAFGLGIRGDSFGRRVYARVPTEDVLDLTGSGPLIDEMLKELSEIERFRPDLAVLGFGMAESLIHPPLWFQSTLERFAPSSWHGVTGLQPRAVYSATPARRYRQRVVATVKRGVKRTAVSMGSHRRMSAEDFGRHLEHLVSELTRLRCRTVLINVWAVDESLAPRTNASLVQTQEVVDRLVERHPGLVPVSPGDVLNHWGDYLADHLHFSEEGHDKVATAIVHALAGTPPRGR